MSVIREDVVSISFDVENNPFAEITASIDEMKAAVVGGVDDSTRELKDMAKGAKEAAKGVSDIANSAKDMKGTDKTFTQMVKSVKDIAKTKIDNNLNKLKSIPQQAKGQFDKLKTSVAKIKNIKLSDIGKGLDKGLGKALTTCKKGASDLVTSLKKVASVSFNGAVNGLKTMTEHAKTAATALGKGLVTGTKAVAAGVGAAAVAVGGLVAKSVQSYADFEQLIGGVETLFKDSAPAVQKYANNAYKTAGLSANEYMETVTSFSASLLQSLGGDTKKAADYADMAIIDMADNANKMGSDMESIQNAYQGFAKQNYTMLDNLKLGYGGTKEEMQRLVADAAKLDKSVDANSLSYANIVKAIHAVQDEMGILGTTQKEAEKTISGSLASMKSAWGNMLTAIVVGGDSFEQCVDNLVSSVKTFAGNIIPVAKTALSGVGKLIEELAPMIAAEIPALVVDILPALTNAAITMLQSFINAIQSNVGSLADVALQLVNSFVTFISSAVPQLVTVAGQLVVALAQGLGQQLPKLIPTLIQGWLQLVNNLVSLLPELVNAGIQLIQGLAQGILTALPTLIERAPVILQKLVTGITQSLPLIVNAAIQLINSLMSGITQNLPLLINSAIQIMMALINGIVQNLPILINAALQMINALTQGLITNLPLLIQGAISMVQALVQGLINNMPLLIQAAVQLVDGLCNGLLQNLPLLITMAIELTLALMNGLLSQIPLLIQCAMQLVAGLVSGIAQNLPQILTAAIEIIAALAKGLLQAIPQVVAAIPKILSAIKKALTDIDLKSVGKDLMKGFVNGISSMASTVAEKAKNVASGAANAIKKLLGINSPSKLTMGFGQFTGEGLAIGMQDMKKQVTQSAQGLSMAVSTTLQPSSVNAYTPNANSVSNTSNRNTTNNFSPQFTLNMNGSSATESNKRKVKQWVKESIQETFESMGRTNPELVEV